MSSNDHAPGSVAVATGATHATPARQYSYSRRRWNAFEAWQEHVRKSAAAAAGAFKELHDRDMRRPLTG
jgi:alkaline phosphatase